MESCVGTTTPRASSPKLLAGGILVLMAGRLGWRVMLLASLPSRESSLTKTQKTLAFQGLALTRMGRPDLPAGNNGLATLDTVVYVIVTLDTVIQRLKTIRGIR